MSGPRKGKPRWNRAVHEITEAQTEPRCRGEMAEAQTEGGRFASALLRHAGRQLPTRRACDAAAFSMARCCPVRVPLEQALAGASPWLRWTNSERRDPGCSGCRTGGDRARLLASVQHERPAIPTRLAGASCLRMAAQGSTGATGRASATDRDPVRADDPCASGELARRVQAPRWSAGGSSGSGPPRSAWRTCGAVRACSPATL